MKPNTEYDDITHKQVFDSIYTTSNIHVDDDNRSTAVYDVNPRDLANIYKLAEKVIAAYDVLAVKIIFNKAGEFTQAKPTVIGKALDELQEALTDYDTRYGSCHEYISCVLQTMRRYGFNSFYEINIPLAMRDKDWAIYVNNFVYRLRTRLTSDYLQMRVANRLKNARKNFISGRNYVDELFNYYARLNITRVEFGYKYQPNGLPVSIEEAQVDIKALLSQVKKHPAFDHCVGYLGKMEFGYDKGYHFSFIFLFNGSKVKRDVYRCDLIGRLWCDEINPEFGTYHNCNREKEAYREFNGIGMVHYSDLKKRENLVKHVIGYATKSTQMVMVKPGKHDRIFYRGRIPKHVREQNAGRPRAQVRVANNIVDVDTTTGEVL